MLKGSINVFAFFNGVFGFCQWLIYLALLHFISTKNLPKNLMYMTVLMQYAPMSFVPFFLRNKFEQEIKYTWLQAINFFGFFISLLFTFSVFYHNPNMTILTLLGMSCLSGACSGLFLALPSKLTNSVSELKRVQARITAGYYLGVAVSCLMVFFFAKNNFFHFSLLAIAFQCILTGLLRFHPIENWKATSTISSRAKNLTPLFQEGNKVRWYFIFTSVRYLSWGIISFLFPIAVIQHLSMPSRIFAITASFVTLTMVITLFFLGSSKQSESTDFRWSAGWMNIFNGLLVTGAYLAPSFLFFIVPYFLASVVSMIAEVKTCSGFIGNSDIDIRGRLSALTISLRFLGMGVGNVLTVFLCQQSWYLGPVLITILLVGSGVACFWLLDFKHNNVEVYKPCS